MPFPVGAAIAGGVALASSVGNMVAQGNMNEATRRWNEQMYARQRGDALLDWERQNQYNSPAAQMARFKEAGLNPNLIYGQTNTAAPVRSTEAKSWTPQAPDVAGIGRAAMQGLSAYQDYTLQSEQIKNMATQRQNMQIDALLKTAELASKNLKNAQNLELYDTTVSTAKELLRSMETRTDISISQEVRNAAMHAPSLLAAIERVSNLSADTEVKKQQLDNLKGSRLLQETELNLRRQGFSWQDPVILRMLAQLAEGKSIPDFLKDIWKLIQSSGGPSHDDVITTPN